jgi:HSP20 family molecular chaperone IbpA
MIPYPDRFSGRNPGKIMEEGITGKTRAGNNKEMRTSMQTNRSYTPGPAQTVEPGTTVLDEGKFLHILTELPGVHEEMIRIDIDSTTVTIAASDARKQVKKMITLPCEVSFCMKRFSGGVLTLTLEKKGS